MTSDTTEVKNSYPTLLQEYLGSLYQVINDGIPGQTSLQIAVRSGGKITNVTTQQEVVDKEIKVLFPKGEEPLNVLSDFSLHGSIGGINGILLPDNTFLPSEEMKLVTSPIYFNIDNGNLYKGIVIIWVGRNDFNDEENVIKNIELIVSSLQGNKRFIILSIINGEEEGRGSLQYKKIQKINKKLKETYKENYVDIRSELVNHFNFFSFHDVVNRIQDIPPASLRIDGIHLNRSGNEIVSRVIARRIFRFQ